MPFSDAMTESAGNVQELLAKALGLPLDRVDYEFSFTANGGTSLSAVRLAHEMRNTGWHVDLNKILKSQSLFELLQQVTKVQTIDSEYLSDDSVFKDPASAMLANSADLVSSEDQTFPMTEMQMALCEPSNNFNRHRNVVYATHGCRTDTVDAVARAWRHVLVSESIFSVKFQIDNCMAIHSDTTQIASDEICFNTDDHFEQAVDLVIAEPNAATWPSITIVRPTSSGSHRACVVIHFHHSTVDLHSLFVLKRRVALVLAGKRADPGAPFSSFAHQMNQHRAGLEISAIVEKYRTRQKTVLGESVAEPVLPKPQISSTTRRADYRLHFRMPREQIDVVAAKSQVSISSLYHSAWALALAKMTGSHTVSWATVISGRHMNASALSEIVGPVFSVMPLAIQLNGGAHAQDLLQEVYREQLLASEHSMDPGIDKRGLFSAVNVYPYEDKDEFGILNADIPVQVCILNAESGYVQGDPQHTTAQCVDCFRLLFSSALESLCIGGSVASLLVACQSWFNDDDLLRAGNFFNTKTRTESSSLNLASMMSTVARSSPSLVAVERGEQAMTYEELDSRSSHVAWHLRESTSTGDVVCVVSDRSFGWIIAIYGILKAGCIYCPLDQKAPSAVQEDLINQAGARMVLTPQDVRDLLQAPLGPVASPMSEAQDKANVEHAYLCFTSGSTGKAKAVLNTHRGLAAFQSDLQVRLHSAPGQRIAQNMSPSFDGSIHEIFSALSYGGTLLLKESETSSRHLQEATALLMTPSMARITGPQDYPLLKQVYLVGEPVTRAIVDTWAASKELYNMYGPTEAACGATIKRLESGHAVSLGRPTPTMRIYILNDSLDSLMPAGVAGEICLAGTQVSQGYLGLPEKNAQSFKPDPFMRHSETEERMYCTGDYGYWDSALQLQILHRKDRQAKVNGFRIDAEDLEHRILDFIDGCSSVKVLLDNDRIAAFLTPEKLDKPYVCQQLRGNLPRHALPTDVKLVSEFPVTASGKIDDTALIESLESAEIHHGRIGDFSSVMLQTLWMKVLRLEVEETQFINESSTLWEMGGTSVTQVMLSKELQRILGVDVPLKILANNSRFDTMLSAIQALKNSPRSPPMKETLIRNSPVLLSSTEETLWSSTSGGVLPGCFNVTMALDLPETADFDTVRSAVDETFASHLQLRTRFVSPEGDSAPVKSDEPRSAPASIFARSMDVHEEINRPFRPGEENMARCFFNSSQILLVISHLVCDFAVLDHLLDEIDQRYQVRDGKTLMEIEEGSERHSEEAAPLNLDFWRSYLHGAPVAKLPQCSPNHDDGSSFAFKLPTDLARLIHDPEAHKGRTVVQILQAAAGLAISSSDEADIDQVIGTPYMDRSIEELANIETRVQPLPVRVSGSNNNPLEAYLDNVQHSSQAAISHAAPWPQLAARMQTPASLLTQTLFTTMVSHHDLRKKRTLFGYPLASRFLWTQGAKFPLLLELSSVREDVVLGRVEFCHAFFSPRAVVDFIQRFVAALECLLTLRDGVLLGDARRHVHVRGHVSDDGLLAATTFTRDAFGRPLKDVVDSPGWTGV